MRASAPASQRITGSFQMSGICRLYDSMVGLLVAHADDAGAGSDDPSVMTFQVPMVSMAGAALRDACVLSRTVSMLMPGATSLSTNP
jgi:hypothetical protein